MGNGGGEGDFPSGSVVKNLPRPETRIQSVVLEEPTFHRAAKPMCHNLSEWRSLSRVRLFATPWTIQSRILEWVAFPLSRGSSQPRDRTQVSHSYWAWAPCLETTTAEPTSWNHWSWAPESPCSTREDTTVRSPCTAARGAPLTAARAKPAQQGRPSTASINK